MKKRRESFKYFFFAPFLCLKAETTRVFHPLYVTHDSISPFFSFLSSTMSADYEWIEISNPKFTRPFYANPVCKYAHELIGSQLINLI